MRTKYDIKDFEGKGVRGKYVKAYRSGTNLVLLDADVASAFPDAKVVNDTLRAVMRAALPLRRRTSRPARTRTKAARAG
jgi:hypothetical protein